MQQLQFEVGLKSEEADEKNVDVEAFKR